MRLAIAFIKHQASAVNKEWDIEVRDASLCCILVKTMARVCKSDPVQGDCCVNGNEMMVRRKKGDLSLQKNWRRLVMDVTHRHFLILVDCGRYCSVVWRPL